MATSRHPPGARPPAHARAPSVFHRPASGSGSSIASGPPSAPKPHPNWARLRELVRVDTISEAESDDPWTAARAEREANRAAAVQLAQSVLDRHRPPARAAAAQSSSSRFVALFDASSRPVWGASAAEKGDEERRMICGRQRMPREEEEDMWLCIRYLAKDVGRDWGLRKRG